MWYPNKMKADHVITEFTSYKAAITVLSPSLGTQLTTKLSYNAVVQGLDCPAWLDSVFSLSLVCRWRNETSSSSLPAESTTTLGRKPWNYTWLSDIWGGNGAALITSPGFRRLILALSFLVTTTEMLEAKGRPRFSSLKVIPLQTPF